MYGFVGIKHGHLGINRFTSGNTFIICKQDRATVETDPSGCAGLAEPSAFMYKRLLPVLSDTTFSVIKSAWDQPFLFAVHFANK